jgi:hypothetical protein
MDIQAGGWDMCVWAISSFNIYFKQVNETSADFESRRLLLLMLVAVNSCWNVLVQHGF